MDRLCTHKITLIHFVDANTVHVTGGRRGNRSLALRINPSSRGSSTHLVIHRVPVVGTTSIVESGPRSRPVEFVREELIERRGGVGEAMTRKAAGRAQHVNESHSGQLGRERVHGRQISRDLPAQGPNNYDG